MRDPQSSDPPSLSPGPVTTVITLEHTRLWPGAVAAALTARQSAVLTGTADELLWDASALSARVTRPTASWKETFAALHPWARARLYALILPADLYCLRRTAPMTSASPDSD